MRVPKGISQPGSNRLPGVTYTDMHRCHLSGYIGIYGVGNRTCFDMLLLNSWDVGSRDVDPLS